MTTPILKAALGLTAAAAFFLPFHTAAHAAANTPQVRDCVRAIAQQERLAARSTKGDERRALIAALGKAKMDCMNGDLEKAYKTAAKLKLDPQQAATGN